MQSNPSLEWLQTNRLGSFAMGSVDRVPRRKYHSLLMLREPGHGESLNALLEVGEYIEVGDSLAMLHSFDFQNRIEPKGFQHLESFEFRPRPKWTYSVQGMKIERALEFDIERDVVRLFYTFSSVKKPFRLRLRPFVLCRPMHHLTQKNPFLNGNAKSEAGAVTFQFYDRLPRIAMRVLGQESQFKSRGDWVDRLYYSIEESRGYPAREDAYIPGEFVMEVTKSGSLVFEAGVAPLEEATMKPPAHPKLPTLAEKLEWAADQYVITTKAGFHSVIAGYPWFGHWSRDSFLSLPGLCIDTGELKRAANILKSYGPLIVEGLTKHGIVCAFPDKGVILTGVDAPLLFIRAVQSLREVSREGHDELMPFVLQILNALKHGADWRVSVSPDGGLYVKPGPWTTSWMDVMMDGHPVTPRAGFAVDLNALFLNAVHFALEWSKAHDKAFTQEWESLAAQADEAFLRRFWSKERGYLADAHDGNVADSSLRPNQLWALSLPFSPVPKEIGEKVLAAVRKELLTPVGLRTLAPADPRYRGKCEGSQRERDLAYHQGTVWPWLLGIYADAVFQVHGAKKMKDELKPVLDRLFEHMEKEGCLGHIAEVFDGDAPHIARGAPAQAWSLAEVLRIEKRMHL